jgi:serine/threonine-protein kinase HipA
MTTTARVILWGSDIGAVTWLPDQEIGVFQYSSHFADSGIQVAPMMMPLREAPYQFPALPHESFRGLPGMLADCLPDKFGNALINAWLAGQGRRPSTFNPVERLCYTGSRAIGALEFKPTLTEAPKGTHKVAVDALVDLASRVLDERVSLEGKFSGTDDKDLIEDILRVGTSAGGARAKGILAWNEETGEFRSGQVPAGQGFTHWLMKFDGVRGNRDRDVADPLGYGRIEYAYYLMAQQAGIQMNACRLHEEGGRAHFMAKRFDRTPSGGKLHMQSLAAIMHYDFNQPDAYSYEQAIQTIRQLGLPMSDVEQQVRRAALNLMARNQDDHVKNIAFLMTRNGEWRLSPAFDVAYSYNPDGDWTSRHQMSVNGKRDGFDVDDLVAFAATGGVKKVRAKRLFHEVSDAVRRWRDHAEGAGLQQPDVERVEKTFRTELFV